MDCMLYLYKVLFKPFSIKILPSLKSLCPGFTSNSLKRTFTRSNQLNQKRRNLLMEMVQQ
jgi:hypothetical protein